MKVKTQELFNFYSHFAGAVAAIIGTVYLAIAASDSASGLVTALIYGISVVFLFSASTLYHAFKKEENELSFWRKMDRLAIFFMIAGTFTPICYFCLDGAYKWMMIAFQWSLVGVGLISQIFFPGAPRKLYAVIYLFMGWSALFTLKQMLANMSSSQAILLVSGGVSFTIGAIIYAVKKPRMIPGIFSFHELFHIMVLIGGILHYAMIYGVYSHPGV
ncbi:MAG TPA: hemolysin III family protein [Smithellaceae bacterium]|jgi:hemolysin III|nr:hemolysin III family protein [Syntrophaceae bacterium]NMC92616.1 hemolysin III family protein [Smithella sp.]HNV55958.1 hemolysin III family protein [Smithellaceae bacterium]MBP8666624.1 hemolysin III family protein [Syntrophaceae bacterium]MBP9532508.1 hemolysin III family protein [Syntrophaceae bacterium]